MMNTEAKNIQTKALPLFGGEEPGPVKYIVEGLILDHQLNGLFGDGGLGKSYLALHLAFCVATARPFFGRAVSKCPVLYIDVENLGHEETLRRAFQIGRGYGHAPDGGVYYYSPEKALGSKEATAEVRLIIQELGIGFIVLDSLTLGAVGTNASDQVEVVALLKEVHSWGVAVLTLDHITKAARSDQSSAQAFGSVMKRNAARSMLRLHEKDGLLVLTHDKINCGPKADPVYYNMGFVEDEGGIVTVTFTGQDAPSALQPGPFVFDATLEEIRPKPPSNKDEVYSHVTLHYEARRRPADSASIAAVTRIDRKSVTALLSALQGEGLIARAGRGLYIPLNTEGNQPTYFNNPYREEEEG